MILKSCPFCGGKPYLEESQRGFVNGESTKVCYVRCMNCNARSPRENIHDYGRNSRSGEALEKVAELWNKRADHIYEFNYITRRERKKQENELNTDEIGVARSET